MGVGGGGGGGGGVGVDSFSHSIVLKKARSDIAENLLEVLSKAKHVHKK